MTSIKLSKYLLILLTGCYLLAGCTPHNVVFYGKYSPPSNPTQSNTDPINLYLDAFGDLYPFGEFRNLANSKAKPQLFLQVANHRDVTCYDSQDKEYASKLCSDTLKGKLNDDTSDAEYLEKRTHWESAQETLWESYAKKVVAKLPSEKSGEILLLIHGFNTTSERMEPFVFAPMRNRYLSETKTQPSAIIQVNWDGFAQKGWLSFLHTWTKAQASGSLAGFELRQLIYHIDRLAPHKPKYRVITHSSGAFVAGTLFGNPVTAQPLLCNKPKEIQKEYSWFKTYEAITLNNPDKQHQLIKQHDLRLLMFAPATPSNTFTGDEVDRCPEERSHYGFNHDDSQIYFSVNKRDYALSKSPSRILRIFFSTRFRTALGGSTALGVDRNHAIQLKKDKIEEKKNIKITFEDYCKDGECSKEHDLQDYLNAPESKLLFSAFTSNETK